MPRIAHVISTVGGVGGAERLLDALLRGGSARNWDQLVLVPFSTREDGVPPGMAGLADARTEFMDGSRWSRLPGVRGRIGASLKEFGADVVHAHLFHAVVAVGSTASYANSVRLQTHHHGDLFRHQKKRLKLRLDRWAGSRFDAVVAVSNQVRRFLVDDYRYPATSVVSIPNGWEGEVPESTGFASAPTIVCVANLRSEKGHSVLLSAVVLVQKVVPDVRLLLVGAGPVRAPLRAQVARLDLESAVDFVGSVVDVWPYLKMGHVFALASVVEPLGIAVQEAMAAGLPVIATNTGGLPELVQPGVTGELVPPHDEVAMAEQLIRYLKDPDLRRRAGRAGRKAAASMTMARTVDRYFELYEELLAAKRARS